MKSSQYNIISKGGECGEIILFNALYGSITIWDKSGFQIANQLLENPNLSMQDETTKFIMHNLKNGKYIIDDNINEINIVKNRKVCGMKDDNRLDVIIMPNMTCNFACPYCYESHDPSFYMDLETEESIKQWLMEQIPKYKVLLLNWFGGEPLLSFEQIISIGKLANEICNLHDIELITNITTNGYLLNEIRIEELIGIKIFSYQITIDGPPEIHNKTRSLKNGKDSFWKIFENISLLVRSDDRVRISLRVNFNHNNIYAIPDLLNIFPDDIRSSLSIVFEPIFGEKCWSATENLPNDEISSKMVDYYRLARQKGYDVTLGDIGMEKLVYCYAERENQYIFNYNGDIFKCSVSFNQEERFGYLNSNGRIILNEKQWDKWFKMDLFEQKCYLCKFLPLCMGGCRNMRKEQSNTGSFCSLIPTNTSFALKAIALDKFNELLCSQYINTNDNSKKCI